MRVPNSSSITGRATHAINANGTVAGSDRNAAPAGSALNLLKSALTVRPPFWCLLTSSE
jgi:hypothetical protein